MKDCYILIAGARGGVGSALAHRLRAEGARLALVSRTWVVRDAAADDVFIEADVSSVAGARLALEQAAQAAGRPPDGMVNACGSILIAGLPRTSEAQYRDTLAANLDTSVFLCQAYLASLAAAKQGGAIVLFSSVAARIGVANHAAIAVAKAGVEALVRSVAADASANAVRINAIAPGLLDTALGARFLSNEPARRQMAAQYPLGRVGDAEAAAALARFLLWPESQWITGQVLGLDGGFTAVRPPVRVA